MIRDWLGRAQRRANLRAKGPHTLRHTFCSHLAMRAAPARAIQDLAGHRHLTTTQRYMHLSPSALRDAITLLERGEDDANQPASKRKLETGWRRGSSEEESE
jgi:site-specific recombinase XerD